MNSSKHEFSLYVPLLNEIVCASKAGKDLFIPDAQLATRLSSILRLRVGASFILFDRSIHVRCMLVEITKKGILCTLDAKSINTVLSPSITFIMPLLKKDDFEAALYSLVEIGINKIQIVITEKIQRSWGGDKEFERAQRIMIAASEQSKNYVIPELSMPISLPDYIKQIRSSTQGKVYFDPTGPCADKVLQELNKQSHEFFLMVGPEGDLTTGEKQMLLDAHFQFCALTPTILRSAQAVALGAGIFRIFFRS